jgi:hypothetical protein
MRYTYTVHVPVEQPGVYHIPGVHNCQLTLCGFVDIARAEEAPAREHPCNCGTCIDALKRIQEMRFPKGYFATQPGGTK